MTATVQLSLGGVPVAADFYSAIQALEVEERADGPGSLTLRLPVNRTSAGDLQYVGDGTFEPSTGITVVVTPAGQADECIFDGYVLAWQLHLDRTSGSSTIEVWAEDASWLMNISDTVREWAGMTDGEVANEIFSGYGFTSADGNTDDDSPAARRRRAQPVPARDRPPLPARPRAPQRQALPRRLHRHARRAHRLLRLARARRHARGDHLARRSGRPGRSTRSTSTGTSCVRPRSTRARCRSTTTRRAASPGDATDSGLAPLDDARLSERTRARRARWC